VFLSKKVLLQTGTFFLLTYPARQIFNLACMNTGGAGGDISQCWRCWRGCVPVLAVLLAALVGICASAGGAGGNLSQCRRCWWAAFFVLAVLAGAWF
jgi:hypothetical protein